LLSIVSHPAAAVLYLVMPVYLKKLIIAGKLQ